MPVGFHQKFKEVVRIGVEQEPIVIMLVGFQQVVAWVSFHLATWEIELVA